MFDTLIDRSSLVNNLENPDWLIFDTRYDLMNKDAGKEAYQQGHIPGAVYVDLHDDLSGPPVTNHGRHPLPKVEAMNTLFSRLGIKNDTQVIVYDDIYGSFAARLWWMLRHMQHKNVAVLDEGWQAWIESGAPVSSSIEKFSTSRFSQSALDNDLVEIEHVQEYDIIIDSRDPARFRGDFEPIDKAAGHIPGAKNRFWKDNLTESGKFKSKADLKSEFRALFGSTDSENSVFYCGSGVTACHNLLAACHAGLRMPKLYAGSWSEWSSYPEKPVEIGN